MDELDDPFRLDERLRVMVVLRRKVTPPLVPDSVTVVVVVSPSSARAREFAKTKTAKALIDTETRII